MIVHLLSRGPISQVSGGYLYNRSVLNHLRVAGYSTRYHGNSENLGAIAGEDCIIADGLVLNEFVDYLTASHGGPALGGGGVLVVAGKSDVVRAYRTSARGDLNCDGVINALDIEPFLVALFDPDEYPVRFPDCDIDLADINQDGRIDALDIDALDIEPFLRLLFGP